LKHVATSEFDQIKLGQIGTVRNLETGAQWEGEFYVEGKRLIHSEPAKEVLTVASVRRLVTKTPGHVVNSREKMDPAMAPYTPDRIEVRLGEAWTRCNDLDVRWFEPTDPPRFFTPPATVADAVTS
jgi:hypothetical protein